MDATTRDRAVDQAYRDFAPDLYRVAYGVLHDADEAVDATHDAFARAWERWEQYDSQRPLRSWLHGIVVHVALDHLRRRRVRRLAVPVLGGRVIAEIRTARSGDPATEVERRRVVEDALAGLPPKVRAVLVLRHYFGYDYAEIGTYLGMRSGTVGSTLSRAHVELRRRLAPDDPTAKADAGFQRHGAPAGAAPARDQHGPPEVLR